MYEFNTSNLNLLSIATVAGGRAEYLLGVGLAWGCRGSGTRSVKKTRRVECRQPMAGVLLSLALACITAVVVEVTVRDHKDKELQ